MRIIHYIIGVPPLASGGLTKYAIDLMEEEKRQGHEVMALYPSANLFPWNKRIRFDKRNSYKDIPQYRIKGAMPVPLMYGINNPKDYIRPLSDVGRETIRHFFEAVKPDVMHVHTLMGLPIELLQEAKSQGIRIVYTSHDYFGLCPKVNFINHLGELCEGASVEKCAICNSTAKWRPWMLWLRNSKLGVSLKKILR